MQQPPDGKPLTELEINPLSDLSENDIEDLMQRVFPTPMDTQLIESGRATLESASETPGLRSVYQQEVLAIQKKWGDLEAIRGRLGLSRRKICQLLLVDPSSWTRWIKPGQDAPTYIYRSLEWYLNMLEQDPSKWPRAVGYPDRWSSMNTRELQDLKAKLEDRLKTLESTGSRSNTDISASLEVVQRQSRQLAQRLQDLQQIGGGWKILLIINTLVWVLGGIFLLIGA